MLTLLVMHATNPWHPTTRHKEVGNIADFHVSRHRRRLLVPCLFHDKTLGSVWFHSHCFCLWQVRNMPKIICGIVSCSFPNSIRTSLALACCRLVMGFWNHLNMLWWCESPQLLCNILHGSNQRLPCDKVKTYRSEASYWCHGESQLYGIWA